MPTCCTTGNTFVASENNNKAFGSFSSLTQLHLTSTCVTQCGSASSQPRAVGAGPGGRAPAAPHIHTPLAQSVAVPSYQPDSGLLARPARRRCHIHGVWHCPAARSSSRRHTRGLRPSCAMPTLTGPGEQEERGSGQQPGARILPTPTRDRRAELHLLPRGKVHRHSPATST